MGVTNERTSDAADRNEAANNKVSCDWIEIMNRDHDEIDLYRFLSYNFNENNHFHLWLNLDEML